MSQSNPFASATTRSRELPWIDVRAWVAVGVSGAALAVPITPYALLALSMPTGEGVEFATRPNLGELLPAWLLWVMLPVVAGLFATLTLATFDALSRRPIGRIGILRGVLVGLVSCLLFSGWLGLVWPLGMSLSERIGSAVFAMLVAGMFVAWLTALVGGFVAVVHDRARVGAHPAGDAPTPASPSS